jgi:putative hydrolase of the HAD superfamily
MSTHQKYLELEAKQNKDISDLIRYREVVDTLFQDQTEEWRAKMARNVNDVFWRAAVKNFAIRKSTRPCLAKLKKMNLQTAIVSNHHNPDALLQHLDRLRLSPYFACVFISASVGYRKPGSRIFNDCLSQLGVEKQQAVFVGDSLEYDVEGAKRAGIRSILLTDEMLQNQRSESGTCPDFTINDLMEVPKIVSSL